LCQCFSLPGGGSCPHGVARRHLYLIGTFACPSNWVRFGQLLLALPSHPVRGTRLACPFLGFEEGQTSRPSGFARGQVCRPHYGDSFDIQLRAFMVTHASRFLNWVRFRYLLFARPFHPVRGTRPRVPVPSHWHSPWFSSPLSSRLKTGFFASQAPLEPTNFRILPITDGHRSPLETMVPPYTPLKSASGAIWAKNCEGELPPVNRTATIWQ
jgi:hypothetical protein